jgi:hypothetical protein
VEYSRSPATGSTNVNVPGPGTREQQ